MHRHISGRTSSMSCKSRDVLRGITEKVKLGVEFEMGGGCNCLRKTKEKPQVYLIYSTKKMRCIIKNLSK